MPWYYQPATNDYIWTTGSLPVTETQWALEAPQQNATDQPPEQLAEETCKPRGIDPKQAYECTSREQKLAVICAIAALILIPLIIWGALGFPGINRKYVRTVTCLEGVTYKKVCYDDVRSFALAFAEDKCAKNKEGLCDATCDEFMSFICEPKNASRPVCRSPAASKLNSFHCQDREHYTDLSREELAECRSNLHCSRLKAVYPCLAGYLHWGRVICSRRCPPDGAGETMSAFGYCFRHTKQCKPALTELVNALGGTNLGYSFTLDDIEASTDWPQPSNTTKHLTYPMLLAYNILIEKAILKPEYNKTISEFLRELETNGDRLTRLYVGENDLITQLISHAKTLTDQGIEFIEDDRLLSVVNEVMTTNCSSFINCPPYPDYNNVRRWTLNAFNECTIAKALMSSTHRLDSVGWYESISYMLRAKFPLRSLSVIFPSTLASEIATEAGPVLVAGELGNATFLKSFELCKSTKPASILDDVTLPKLFGVWNILQPGSISSFALVLPSVRSVQRTICATEAILPSVDCELRLYASFLGFMPEPNIDEERLIGTNRTIVVYFILRAIARRQAEFGATVSPFSDIQPEPMNMTDVRGVASSLVSECLQRL